MVSVEQFLFDHWMSVDVLIDRVVSFMPEREFYGNHLNDPVLRRMQRDLDGLIYRRHRQPDNEDIQYLYHEKITHYNQALREIAAAGRESYKKKLLSYSHDKKVKILMALIKEYRLLKYLDREG
ncbi:hypothetical protein D3854_03205 [Streptococcus mutans]|uniref:hypothetical protein n=1 Tax=Streptococcus mutans TaxID=1309 RepID=UPI00066D3E93|nr:hypothetical protein [Streptococcus mutans]MCB5054104.1 hypothetical protein [Streptococcus mutans]MCY7119261.1 hypothetical protein [Streptococcus mutans]NLQ51249.1 hypothetical protein [Streptococcus mutans]NLQ85657.1 hypothetical protein [Streptococcus mutans]NLR00895.1 hypothetical protein [Streptococcus mutans]